MALERQSLLAVAKELKKLIAAVRVVGIRTMRTGQWIERLKPIRDDMVWTRPEIRKLRTKLSRAIHNMERQRTSTRHLKNLLAAEEVIEALIKMMGRDSFPTTLSIGKHEVVNVWGLSARELMPVVRRVRKISQLLEDAGFKDLGRIEVIVNPDEAPDSYATYAPSDDAIYLNPGKKRQPDRDLLEEFGDRLWVREFESRDRETWGRGTSGWAKFSKAWVSALDGRGADPDTAARLAVTAGRHAGLEKWEKAVA